MDELPTKVTQPEATPDHSALIATHPEQLGELTELGVPTAVLDYNNPVECVIDAGDVVLPISSRARSDGTAPAPKHVIDLAQRGGGADWSAPV